MKKELKINLDNTINEFSFFLEREFSSRFKNLSNREDRQLFFLARILARLKYISKEIKEDEKVLTFPIPALLEKSK